MFYEKIALKRDCLNNQIAVMQNKLSTFPEGELLCRKNTKYEKWYLSNSGSTKYIPKKDSELATLLSAKKYYTCLLEDLIFERNLLENLLLSHASHPSKSTALLDESSNYHHLLVSEFQNFSEYNKNWLSEDYQKNGLFPEQLIHPTNARHKVRSKSKVNIANELFRNHIPYRYECVLHLDDSIFFPDFTILHPETHEIYYWEHLGLMDNPNYRNNAFSKLKKMAEHGILPGINLIITCETKQNPNDCVLIAEYVKLFFL